MKITVLGVGKIKEKYWNDAIAEYSRRLGKYCTLTVTQVADEATIEGASEAVNHQVIEKEGDRLLRELDKCSSVNTTVIALAIKGKQLDSVEFSGKLSSLMLAGTSHIVFVIGGSLGLSERVLNRADILLSFSLMTFPHQLMRVVLLEQIYRAFRIRSGEPYHK